MATIQQIIGKINPKLYAENGKELLKKYGSAERIPAEEIKPKILAEHKLVYDSSSETLEPVYFFILDLMDDFDLATEKFADNFSATPGSGHFAELAQRATIMQQQASKIMADIGIVLRSVLNIIYDLKEFRIRLQYYDDLKLDKKDKKEAALLSLKQIWMDKVDITKGNSSIKAMAFQAGFQTLIDAFLVAKDEKDVNKLDLNDRVKRILKPRIQEFTLWLEQSEKELKKRYEIERTYLRSQVNALKLYSRWAKPYLRATQKLEMKEFGREPALVKVFNTILLELTLLGKLKLKVRDSALEGKLPADFAKERFLKSLKREYYSCILVDFKFRGIPQRISSNQPHYVFGGKAEVTFRAYSLNDDELEEINKELEKSDIGDVLRLIEGTTTESLEQLQDEINFFLEEKSEEETKSKFRDESNPFLALIGHYEKKSEAPKESKSLKKPSEDKPIKPDNFNESEHLRTLAAENAVETAFKLFDVYKKAHGMPSYT
ncbi:hypothetical protein ES703_13002 [subsurface metagenome]